MGWLGSRYGWRELWTVRLSVVVLIRLVHGLSKVGKQAKKAGPVFGPIISRIGRKAQFKTAGKRLAFITARGAIIAQFLDPDDVFDKFIAHQVGLKKTSEVVDVFSTRFQRSILINPISGLKLASTNPRKFIENLVDANEDLARGLGLGGIPTTLIFAPEIVFKAQGEALQTKDSKILQGLGKALAATADFVF